MKYRYYIIFGIVTLLLMIIILAAPSYEKQSGKESKKNEADSNDNKQYVCSMHPQIIRDKPGDCPICGMFLIELISNDANSFDSLLIDIVPSVNESVLAAVRTVTPELKAIPVSVEASGIINYDPGKIQTVSARFGGLIQRSFVKYQFQYIKKDQKIYEIYNPYVYTERWNYVRLIQAYPDRDDLTAEAIQWFRLLGLSQGQIDSLKRATVPDYYLPVYCYSEGYAVSSDFNPETYFYDGGNTGSNPQNFITGAGSVGLNDGTTIKTGDPLFKLIDITALRIDLKVKTEFGPLLERGQKVTVIDAANPDKQFNCAIDEIEPLNGDLFQTVRIYIKDKERVLSPGRQMEALIQTGTRNGLWVPVTAVANLGKNKSVFVFDDNKFIAKKVSTGVRVKDKIEILSGIDQYSRIAEKALLLIDSDGFISLR